MDSCFIDCILSALRDLDSMIGTDDDYSELRELRFMLRSFNFFYWFLRQLVNSTSLEYLLKIENTFSTIADQIHTFRLDFHGELFSPGFCDLEIREDVASLEEQVDEFCANLSDVTRLSVSFTNDEILKIINFFPNRVAEFLSIFPHYDFFDELKALEEPMKFLGKTVDSAIKCNVESTDDLLAHVGVLAFDAAYLLLKLGFYISIFYVTRTEHPLKLILSLAKKAKHPQVYVTYIEVLTSPNRATTRALAPTDQETDDESFIAKKDVLYYLILLLREVLTTIPLNYQLQELYHGLISRKRILKQPDCLNVKIKEENVTVVHKARDFIISLYRSNGEFDLGQLEDLLGAIKRMTLPEKREKYPQVPSTTLPAYVDYLLERIKEMTNWEAETNSKCQALTIQKELISLRSFLKDIVELRNDEEKSQSLWGRVFEVAHKVEDLMDCLLFGDYSDSISASLECITKDIRNIQLEINVLKKSESQALKKSEIEVKEATTTRSHVRSTTPSITKGIVGFRDQAKSVIEIVKRNSNKLHMVAIVGMPGLGKTTLAEKIYNTPYVKEYFHVRAWVVVSQTLDKRRVLIDILKQVSPDKPISSNQTVDDVAAELRRSLMVKRYFIIFDDIWEAGAWSSLQLSFPDCSNGSRILFTSRCNCNFANETYSLQPLTKQESAEILQGHLSLEDGELKTQIVEICKGMPLIIVIVAGVLKSEQPNQWKEILDTLSSDDISKRCTDTLELSYRHLPEHLKPCFLYLALYEEDERIAVEKLVHLWMAEGFIRKSGAKHLSNVAEGYLKDLIDRNLLLVEKRTSRGRVKACRIHDLLHEFCLQKAKEEQFFHIVEGGCNEQLEFNEPCFRWRLCIRTSPENFMEAIVDCSRVRSLLFKHSNFETLREDMFSRIHMGKPLRVLDMERIFLQKFPREIGVFVGLTYLAIEVADLEIPASVGNLSSLETLLLFGDDFLEIILPGSFWNLQKLKYFFCAGVAYLPMENLESSANLNELDRLEGVDIFCQGGNMEDIVKKFPNVRKLKCVIWGVEEDMEIGALALLAHLESLCISIDVIESFPTNLQKLILEFTELSGRTLSHIGKLPSLEVLILWYAEFEGETWEMEEEAFKKIKVLELTKVKNLRCWRGSDDQFGYLEKLRLIDCSDLEEMPDCLIYGSMLRTIDIDGCNKIVKEFVEKIKEAQEEIGNSDLTIQIGRREAQEEIGNSDLTIRVQR